jgi:hypothetical protein
VNQYLRSSSGQLARTLFQDSHRFDHSLTLISFGNKPTDDILIYTSTDYYLGHSPLDQLGLRQIHPTGKRKLETFFASRRIYLSKGGAGHPVDELF